MWPKRLHPTELTLPQLDYGALIAAFLSEIQSEPTPVKLSTASKKAIDSKCNAFNPQKPKKFVFHYSRCKSFRAYKHVCPHESDACVDKANHCPQNLIHTIDSNGLCHLYFCYAVDEPTFYDNELNHIHRALTTSFTCPIMDQNLQHHLGYNQTIEQRLLHELHELVLKTIGPHSPLSQQIKTLETAREQIITSNTSPESEQIIAGLPQPTDLTVKIDNLLSQLHSRHQQFQTFFTEYENRFLALCRYLKTLVQHQGLSRQLDDTADDLLRSEAIVNQTLSRIFTGVIDLQKKLNPAEILSALPGNTTLSLEQLEQLANILDDPTLLNDLSDEIFNLK